MKAILFVLLLSVVYAQWSEDELQAQFADFMTKYGKVYASDEVSTRYENFKATLVRTERANAESNGKATFGVTKFADMTPEEFKTTILMTQTITPPARSTKPASYASLPDSFDWRDKGAVTAVKDQGQCGSCWAFSATEAIESAWILKGHATDTTINLAPQQIVDCDTNGVAGCNGGTTESAYGYIVSAGGQEPSADYPYTGVNGECKFKAADIDAKISGYKSEGTTEAEMQTNLVGNGPLSICLAASRWQDYTAGVMTAEQCCPFVLCTLDHCVQLVGYNSTGATPYYIVRNSWNTNWGVEGYIYLEMGANTCGITDDITWPTSD